MTLPESLSDAELVDVLSMLPEPGDDLQLFRTYPNAPSRGSVRWQRAEDGRIHFVTEMPARYGAVGATRAGLFAAGGWYPAVLTPEGLPTLRFEVTLRLPEGAGGAVGDVLGTGVLRWTGEGERAGIAVVRRPRFTLLEAGPSDVMLLTRGRPRRKLARILGRDLELVPMALSGVIAEAPLRRRLTAHSPGLAYVSDRAYRLTEGMQFVHRDAVARGVSSALVALPDPADRELAATALSEVHRARRRDIDTDRVLSRLRWLPSVNALLSSQRLPFYSEILDYSWPSDPIRDDLCEILDPYAPGPAVYAQLEAMGARGSLVGYDLLAGESRESALLRAGLPPDLLEPWRAAQPPQDYVLEYKDKQLLLSRVVEGEGAPPERVNVRVDGKDQSFSLAPNAPAIPIAAERSVVIDPRQQIRQTSRVRDAWPLRYDWTAASAIDAVNLSRGQIFATGWLTLRRRYDTRNLLLGSLSNSRSDLVSVELGYLRKEGPLLDGWSRPLRLRADLGASILSQSFAETEGLPVAVDSSASVIYDDRVSYDFPLSGRRLSLSAGAGGVPGTAQSWLSASLYGSFVASPHPRVALSARSSAALARSALPHRLLLLGGEGVMRSIPALPACPALSGDGSELPCFPVADARLHGAFELRVAALRGLSVPLGLLWGSELQISAGLEAIAAEIEGQGAWSTGATLGALAYGDILGADLSGIGALAAWPLAWEGLPLSASAVPEIYLRFTQSW